MSKFKSYIVGTILGLLIVLLILRLCYIAITPFYKNNASQNSIDAPLNESANLLVVTNAITLYNINKETISKLIIPTTTRVYHNGRYTDIMSTGSIDNIIDHVKMLTGVKINYYLQTDNKTLEKLKTQILLKNENIYSNLSISNMLKLKSAPKTNVITYKISGTTHKDGLFLVENANLNALRRICYEHF